MRTYISSVNKNIISNDYVISFLFLIEYLPILYNTTLSSFILFHNNSLPSYLTSKLIYISFTNQLTQCAFKSNYSPLFLIPIFILYLASTLTSFIPVKTETNVCYSILINISEIFIMRLLNHVIFDVCCNIIFNTKINVIWSICAMILLLYIILYCYHHIRSTFLYLNLKPIKYLFFDNGLILTLDRCLFVSKLLLALLVNVNDVYMLNNSNNKSILTFVSFAVYAFNLCSFMYVVYLLLHDNFTYIGKHNLSLFIRLLFFTFNVLIQLLITIENIQNENTFWFLLCIAFVIALFISFGMKYYSIDKVLKNPQNALGQIMYLLNTKDNSDAYKKESFIKEMEIKRNEEINMIICEHRVKCLNTKCQLCKKLNGMKQHSLRELNEDAICIMLYHYLFKQNKNEFTYISSNNNSNSYSHTSNNTNVMNDIYKLQNGQTYIMYYYYLIKVFISFISKRKSLIQLTFKYHKILSKIRHTQEYASSKEGNIFSINLAYLYYSFSKALTTQAEIQMSEYLIQTDKYRTSLRLFMKNLDNVFLHGSKDASELLELGHAFSKLKQEIDLEFLTSKENKYNYACVITGFIMQETYNDKLCKNCDFKEMISIMDEVISFGFKYDKTFLIIYDIDNNSLSLKLSGKELIEYNGKVFESIFPPELRREGKQKFISMLTKSHSKLILQKKMTNINNNNNNTKVDHSNNNKINSLINNENIFSFYYKNQKHQTIETIKMSAFGAPSLDINHNSTINIISKYKIEKTNLLMFKKDKTTNLEILIMLSKSASDVLQLSPNDLNSLIEANKYIYLSDIMTSNGLLNYQNLQVLYDNYLDKKLNVIGKKKMIVNYIESIDNYNIYTLHRCKDNSIILNTNNNTNVLTDNNNSHKNKHKHKRSEISDLSVGVIMTQTACSSSALTKTESSSFRFQRKDKTTSTNYQYRKFLIYVFYIMGFNLLTLILVTLFFVIEFMKCYSIENSFNSNMEFMEFQSLFYITSLSIFTLTCTTRTLNETSCRNLLLDYSIRFSNKYNLTSQQLIYEYIKAELPIKSSSTMTALKTFENSKHFLQNTELNDILNRDFLFYSIIEVNKTVQIEILPLSFEDAVRRYISIVDILSTSSEFLYSPVYTITFNGTDGDLSNIMDGKEPSYAGFYLNDVQKLFYMVVMNYQRYTLRMMSVGNLQVKLFNQIIDNTNIEIMCFIIGIIVIHLIMLAIVLHFIQLYRDIHYDFMKLIIAQLLHPDFEEYFKVKMSNLKILVELYMENPNDILHQLNSNKEKFKKILFSKRKKDSSTNALVLQMIGQNNMKEDTGDNNNTNNKTQSEIISIEQQQSESTSSSSSSLPSTQKNLVNNNYIKSFLYKNILVISITFVLFFIMSIIFYFVIHNQLYKLVTLCEYCSLNFELTDSLVLGVAFGQILAFTNQTDQNLNYFIITEDLTKDKSEVENIVKSELPGYVRTLINKSILLYYEIEKISAENPLFKSLEEITTIDCSTIFHNVRNAFVTNVDKLYPEVNYFDLFEAVCKSVYVINEYKSEKLNNFYLLYRLGKILDMFEDRTYETIARVYNDDMSYDLYTNIIFIMRPFRTELVYYISTEVIKSIMNNYRIIFYIYLVFNVVFEIVICSLMKLYTVNSIIRSMKEVVMLGKAFEIM